MSTLQAKFPMCDARTGVAAWCFFKQDVFTVLSLQALTFSTVSFCYCIYIALIISDLDCLAFPFLLKSRLTYTTMAPSFAQVETTVFGT